MMIVDVVGRWALFDDGRWMTPVPPFKDFGYDQEAFADAIARFQRNPVAAFRIAGIKIQSQSEGLTHDRP